MDLLGALTAVAFFISAILVFIFRLLGKPEAGYWIGFFEFLLAIPLLILLANCSADGQTATLLHPDRLDAGLAAA